MNRILRFEKEETFKWTFNLFNVLSTTQYNDELDLKVDVWLRGGQLRERP